MVPRVKAGFSDETNFHSVSMDMETVDMETVTGIGAEVETHTLASTYKRRMWFAKPVS